MNSRTLMMVANLGIGKVCEWVRGGYLGPIIYLHLVITCRRSKMHRGSVIEILSGVKKCRRGGKAVGHCKVAFARPLAICIFRLIIDIVVVVIHILSFFHDLFGRQPPTSLFFNFCLQLVLDLNRINIGFKLFQYFWKYLFVNLPSFWYLSLA